MYMKFQVSHVLANTALQADQVQQAGWLCAKPHVRTLSCMQQVWYMLTGCCVGLRDSGC